MRSYKAEGIILSRRNLSESDRILTILTKYYGKISAIAKGVRRIKSKKAPHLDQLSYSSLVLAKGRDLDLVVEASTIETFPKIRKNLYASATAFYGAELVDCLTGEKVEGKNIFLLFLDFLREIATVEEITEFKILRFAFETKLLFTLGFWSHRQFKIGVREREILSRLLETDFAKVKELRIENTKGLEMILKQETEKIAERKLKSPEILVDLE